MKQAWQHLKTLTVSSAVLAGLLSGCSRPAGFAFVVATDMRSFTPPEYPGPKYFLGVCQAIGDVGPGDFMISPGDLDPPDRVRATIDQTLGEDYLWYPVVGNHEGHEPAHMAYLRDYNLGGSSLPGIVRCGPPKAVETCYALDHGQAHFVAINQYYDGTGDMVGNGDVSDALYEWLARDLGENERPFVFVFGHEPSVAVPDMDNGRVRHRGSSLDQYPDNNHRFWTLLREHQVVAYFCGHSHNLSVSKINGVWQIDCGHARGLGDRGARSSFVKVYVEPDGVLCEVYRDDGQGGPYRLTYSERLR